MCIRDRVPHVPGAVSPMIAAGRVVKELYPDAMTVFVGPCMAKKKEAREEDIADAVDYVLTFQEVQDIFDAAGIQPELLSEDEKEHSSRAGRIYARTGGVSEAVKKTVEQIDPDKKIPVIPEQADGVPACKKLIERIQKEMCIRDRSYIVCTKIFLYKLQAKYWRPLYTLY